MSQRVFYVASRTAAGQVTVDDQGNMVAAETAPYFRKLFRHVGTLQDLQRAADQGVTVQEITEVAS